jgi:hypothetical protein
MNKKNVYILGVLSLVILVFSFFFRFSSTSLFDSDFWWHISTGRYIVTNGALPDSDPFSFATTLEENRNLHPVRENFILKQYWLSQVIFYLIFNNFGPAGIILLRGVLLTLTIVFVLRLLMKWKVSIPVILLAIFILFLNMGRATGERPVLFTILFTGVTFFILELYRMKKDMVIYLLLPVMLAWSNLHGGFILGIVIIGVYMFGEGVKIATGRSDFTVKDRAIFYSATCAALLVSYLNPTGWDAFLITFSSKYKPFTEGIQEYQSPLFYFVNKLYPISYDYIFLALLFPVLLILRNRKFEFIHFLLLTGLLIMSLTSARFVIYYAIISAAVLAKEADSFLNPLISRISARRQGPVSAAVIAGVCMLVSLSYAYNTVTTRSLHFEIAKGLTVPVNAVNFIEKEKLQGNILNDFAYGGYITWRLYPRKTFIDTRALNLTNMAEYGWMLKGVTTLSGNELKPRRLPLWEKLLDHYDIDIVFLGLLGVYGETGPLIYNLAESDKWAPVYCDAQCVIFVRNKPTNYRIIEQRLSKETVYNRMLVAAISWAMENETNYLYLVTVGQTFYQMGRLNDALTAYRYAVKRLPTAQVRDEIARIEAELEKQAEKKKEVGK